MEHLKICYKINWFSFQFSLKHSPPTNAGRNSSWVLICNGKCHSGGHVATQHEATQHEAAMMNHDKKKKKDSCKMRRVHTKPPVL